MIEIEKINENYISFFNIIGTETIYNIIYEYEWEGKTYQLEVEMGFFDFLDYLDSGTKVICQINTENPNEAVVNAFNPVKRTILLFIIFFGSFVLVATYFLFDSKKVRIIPMKDKREVICICPYCKSEKVGVKDFLNDNNRKIWAYCWICGRTSEKREAPLDISDDDIIELATTEWKNREKRLSLEELEALYLTRYTLEDKEEGVGDDVMHFIAWCRENA